MKINYISKGWGYEKVLDNRREYCGKILHINKDKRCSLHYHKDKQETFFVLSGKIKLDFCDDCFEDTTIKTIILQKDDVFFVPCYMSHRFTALEDSEIIEISTHHEDKDSYRIEKGD